MIVISNLDKLLVKSKGTTMDPSAEFRPINQLEKIFSHHPNYRFVKKTILKGMDYIFNSELTEEQRIAEVKSNLERGNHQSGNRAPKVIEKLM